MNVLIQYLTLILRLHIFPSTLCFLVLGAQVSLCWGLCCHPSPTGRGRCCAGEIYDRGFRSGNSRRPVTSVWDVPGRSHSLQSLETAMRHAQAACQRSWLGDSLLRLIESQHVHHTIYRSNYLGRWSLVRAFSNVRCTTSYYERLSITQQQMQVFI